MCHHNRNTKSYSVSSRLRLRRPAFFQREMKTTYIVFVFLFFSRVNANISHPFPSLAFAFPFDRVGKPITDRQTYRHTDASHNHTITQSHTQHTRNKQTKQRNRVSNICKTTVLTPSLQQFHLVLHNLILLLKYFSFLVFDF
jgi:hypothetical protein